jgi:hypothetical protein
MKVPDFFIVGTFKAGTTALYEYLRQHPGIFMPFHKEPMFFGADLGVRYQRMTRDEYLALFRDADPSQLAGEASPWYLYSTSAAREIHDFNPEARIIVMLRNPVDVMYAQHSQLLFNQREELASFEDALAAEADRRAGRRIPAGALRPEALFYRHSVRFADQLRRYVDVFGRQRVHVIVFEDFTADTERAYRDVLEFLGVGTDVPVDLSVHNPNRRVRSAWIQRLVFRPPGPLRSMVPWLRRLPLVHRLRDRVVALNSEPERREPMNPGLRRRLMAELEPEVRELESLIGRDLRAWYQA